MTGKPGQPGPGTDFILLSYSQDNQCQARLWITALTVLHKVRNIADNVAIEIHISVTLQTPSPAAYPLPFPCRSTVLPIGKFLFVFWSFSFNKPRSHQDKFGSGHRYQSGRLLSEGLRRWGHSSSFTTCGASETPASKPPVQSGTVSPESKVSSRRSHRRPFGEMGLFSSFGEVVFLFGSLDFGFQGIF